MTARAAQIPGRFAERLGAVAISVFNETLEIVGGVGETLALAMQPRSWGRTARAELVRQVYFTGAQPLLFVTLIALLVGVVLILQGLLVLDLVGQKKFIGSLLVISLFREVAPLLVNTIIAGRSGLAITGELATMKATGQIAALESQGIETTRCVMMPRIIGLMIAALSLSLWFIAIAVIGGYLTARLTGASDYPFSTFIGRVMMEVGPSEAALMLLKGTLPALITGVICCAQGLAVGSSTTEPARALPSAFVRSMAALFIVSVALSVVL